MRSESNCGDLFDGQGNLDKVKSSNGRLRSTLLPERAVRSREQRRTYAIWRGMLTRCSENLHYIEKGIKVCARWHEFVAFLADVGTIPRGFSLDRIDSAGDYEPENVRLATIRTQANNRSTNVRVLISGETKTLIEWARSAMLPYSTVYNRYRAGWPPEKLLSPLGTRHKRKGYAARIVTINGQAKTLAQHATDNGLPRDTLADRIRKAWPEDRLLLPSRSAGRMPRPETELTRITIGGETRTVGEWANASGIKEAVIRYRLKAGWDVRDLLSPPRKYPPRNRAPLAMITIGGRTLTIAGWAAVAGISTGCLRERVRLGYSGKLLLASKLPSGRGSIRLTGKELNVQPLLPGFGD